ncbi:dapper homolog 2-like [Polyodon spathula]|uniref:dapper homolog 2-like n=1 Tax=Polyodon spathula TaxID=7913 RepID=UPI001B7DCF37|nr:dapper homolog 2-like [Polyodon spathula]
MQNRKLSCGSSLLTTTAGIDRCRVGERLQAALAGLQELHLLNVQQSYLVQEALEMDQEMSSVSSQKQGGMLDSCSEEQRLEATLASLKEQLSRLRRQDVGLKSHLQQLDHQISELKLDVSKASTEHLESDSRPSSGFYDLSDGGSCSLSNSCTSVYSDCMSSSQSSLPPSCHQPGSRVSMFEYRPRSADETTVHAGSLQQQGMYIRAGCRIRTSTDSRQRPVSTGDLERLMNPALGCQKVPDMKSVSSLCHGSDIQHTAVDPKYQSNLVSRNGSDVYPYPSPLHAVALQSPLFSLSGEASTAQSNATPTEPTNSLQERPVFESRPNGYINRLIQHSKSKPDMQQDSSKQNMNSQKRSSPLSSGGTKDNLNHPPMVKEERVSIQALIHKKAQDFKTVPPTKVELENSRQQGLANCVTVVQRQKYLEESRVVRYPPQADTQNSAFANNIKKCPERAVKMQAKPYPENCTRGALREAALSRKTNRKHSSSTASLEERSSEALSRPEFVHAKFVPAESQQVKVRHASKKTKAVKLKRRSSDKQRIVKPLPCEMPEVNRSPAERALPNKHHGGKGIVRRPTHAEQVASRSCSESSLYPAHLRQLQFAHRPAPRRAHNLYPAEPRASIDLMKKKQARRWQSAMEISGKHALARFASYGADGNVQTMHQQQQLRKPGVMRTSSMQAGPSQYQLHRSVYPDTISESDQSEYSAECASLFHSTIAETSEGEQSDHTANRFGDSESSEGDSDTSSDSSLTLGSEETDEGELVWAEAAMGPTAAGMSLTKPRQAEPRPCRIKASKALKKKILRFQPASLKVMTMV